MKICPQCKESKNLGQFGLSYGKPSCICKKCNNRKVKEYARTPVGLIQRIYQNQKRSSARRGHPAPNYDREWLTNWVTEHPKFQTLFNAWVSSGYQKNLIPSVDRIDDNSPYTKTNITLMTWEDNNLKGNNCYKEGKVGTRVDQLDLEGNYLQTFNTTVLAAEAVGCSRGEITRVCKGVRKTAKGFKWRYTNEC